MENLNISLPRDFHLDFTYTYNLLLLAMCGIWWDINTVLIVILQSRLCWVFKTILGDTFKHQTASIQPLHMHLLSTPPPPFIKKYVHLTIFISCCILESVAWSYRSVSLAMQLTSVYTLELSKAVYVFEWIGNEMKISGLQWFFKILGKAYKSMMHTRIFWTS